MIRKKEAQNLGPYLMTAFIFQPKKKKANRRHLLMPKTNMSLICDEGEEKQIVRSVKKKMEKHQKGSINGAH
jgi:hypothetical protein